MNFGLSLAVDHMQGLCVQSLTCSCIVYERVDWLSPALIVVVHREAQRPCLQSHHLASITEGTLLVADCYCGMCSVQNC